MRVRRLRRYCLSPDDLLTRLGAAVTDDNRFLLQTYAWRQRTIAAKMVISVATDAIQTWSWADYDPPLTKDEFREYARCFQMNIPYVRKEA